MRGLGWFSNLLDSMARADRAERRALAQEAKWYAQVIERRLERLDLCYRYKKSESDFLQSGVQRVRIRAAHLSPEVFYLQVDTARLPRRIKTIQLEDEDILRDLSLACRRPVSAKWGIRSGFWFVIERQEGVRGIPRVVRYSDMLANIPANAGPLAIPVGSGENNRLMYADLADMPHLIVAGATGGGKSVFVNALVLTLIQRNGPDQLQIGMIDLKGGVELIFFKDLPHLLAPITTEKEDVIDTLDLFCKEIDRRLSMFQDVCRDIRGWNFRHRKKPLPYWLLIVDELANIMLDRKLRKEAEVKLEHIAARGRAPGVHAVVATQRPSVDVITGIIKANFPTRIAFACADMASSRTIIDTTEAYGLTPQGRMVFCMGPNKTEIQGPWVTDAMVRDVVRDIKAGVPTLEIRARHDVTREELFLYALANFEGWCSYRELYRAFRSRGIRQSEVQAWCAELEGETIELEGQDYTLLPGSGRVARRLVLCDLCVDDLEKPHKAELPEPQAQAEMVTDQAGAGAVTVTKEGQPGQGEMVTDKPSSSTAVVTKEGQPGDLEGSPGGRAEWLTDGRGWRDRLTRLVKAWPGGRR